MEALVGRDVEVPRSGFAADISRGTSYEPPDGRQSWKGKITEFTECTRVPFVLSLEVFDHDGEVILEEQEASLSQVRKWIVNSSILPHESRKTPGQIIVPAKTPKTLCARSARVQDVFGTPGN